MASGFAILSSIVLTYKLVSHTLSPFYLVPASTCGRKIDLLRADNKELNPASLLLLFLTNLCTYNTVANKLENQLNFPHRIR